MKRLLLIAGSCLLICSCIGQATWPPPAEADWASEHARIDAMFLASAPQEPTPAPIATRPAADEPLPVAVITGPVERGVGKLAVFKATGSVGSDQKWAILPKSAADDTLECITTDGQSALVLSSDRPGEYGVILAVASGGRVAIACHDFRYVGPGPKPDPQPDPKPDPQPDPKPDPTPRKLWVSVVEETAERTPAHAAIYASPTLRKYMLDKGHRWRLVDRHAKGGRGPLPADLAALVARAKSVPWLVLQSTDGRVLHDGPLPASESALMQVVKANGG